MELSSLTLAVLDPRAARLPGMVLEGDTTDSERGFEIMESWLKHCCETHSLCQALSARDQGKEGWIPTRLLEFVPGSRPDGDKVRVCERAPSPPAPYATLSHRWGGKDPIKLQRDNHDQLRLGILISSLPRTFQEAIRTAKRLGITYTWIDSLCIIQDSTEDWMKEAAMMADVYRYGLLNISATASENSDGGLYRQRNLNPRGVMPCALDLRFTGVPHGLYYAVSEALLDGRDVVCQFTDRLRGRRWVFQEHMLAPRIIHFSDNQFFWQYQTLEASESCPEGPALTTDSSLVEHMDRPSLRFLRLSAASQDLCYLWGRIVEEFSDRSLTRKTDRLVAISAIASEIAKIIPKTVTYLAGLWSSHLEQMLLWAVMSGSNEQSGVYVAPTWSWASITGLVSTGHWRDRFDRLLARATATVDARMPFGAVSGGKLKLKGCLRKAEVVKRPPDDTINIHMFRGRTRHIDRSLTFEGFPGINPRQNRPKLDVEENAITSFPVYCIPVLGSGERAYGLLLERIGGPGGPYRRVGIFEGELWVFMSHNDDWVNGSDESEIEVI
ncbi:hypothetical protein DL769_005423 [Monosporascus sp. CRB-8-3]|nr:hypothetical protein DL769_005423 [Monosporascus sp. CRB-8-3]